jgi:hypothetical protein
LKNISLFLKIGSLLPSPSPLGGGKGGKFMNGFLFNEEKASPAEPLVWYSLDSLLSEF